jgi:hypothetical protein
LEADDFKNKEQLSVLPGRVQAEYAVHTKIPLAMPPGYYRFHVDFYAKIHDRGAKTRLLLFFGDTPGNYSQDIGC